MSWSLEHGMMVRRATERGPRVVWIHGLGESSVSFEPVIAKLPGFQHVLVDLPGYGRSPWPERVPSLVELGEQLAGWLAKEPPATIIGHSMGGVLCTFIAERTPVRAVVDIDGNLTRGDCSFSALASAYTLEDFIADGFAEIRAKTYADGIKRPELRSYHAAMCFASPELFHRHSVELVELSTAGTLAPRLAALPVPKLFVAGVPDGICLESRALLDRLGVRWVGIEPAGHWVYLDQLDRFAAAVGAFLRE
ncbi:MAG TPA: alpha/beta hydrolase [Kofleriaceae bacterium]